MAEETSPPYCQEQAFLYVYSDSQGLRDAAAGSTLLPPRTASEQTEHHLNKTRWGG